jgi:hypothetical protein
MPGGVNHRPAISYGASMLPTITKKNVLAELKASGPVALPVLQDYFGVGPKNHLNPRLQGRFDIVLNNLLKKKRIVTEKGIHKYKDENGAEQEREYTLYKVG